MAKYKCPNQVRKNGVSFILCKDLMKDGVNYNLPSEAVSAYCPHQHYCACVSGTENTESAIQCYQEYQSRKGI